VFFGTEPRFTERVPGRHLVVAQQPEWDPQAWAATLRAHRSLREQLRRARAKGVRVRTVTTDELAADPALARAIADTREAWLRGRRMAPMGFLVELASPGVDERLWVCAERDGALIAAASVAAIPARRGTLVEHVLRRREAPNGTTETLVDAAMRLAAARGDGWLTLGMAPLAGDLAWPLRAARWLGRPLYNFAGLHATRARLHPARWTPIHLSVPAGSSIALGVIDALAAFARGSFVRFGLATLRQQFR
jgi:phosphatidylglycerol lysyltransferase